MDSKQKIAYHLLGCIDGVLNNLRVGRELLDQAKSKSGPFAEMPPEFNKLLVEAARASIAQSRASMAATKLVINMMRSGAITSRGRTLTEEERRHADEIYQIIENAEALDGATVPMAQGLN